MILNKELFEPPRICIVCGGLITKSVKTKLYCSDVCCRVEYTRRTKEEFEHNPIKHEIRLLSNSIWRETHRTSKDENKLKLLEDELNRLKHLVEEDRKKFKEMPVEEILRAVGYE